MKTKKLKMIAFKGVRSLLLVGLLLSGHSQIINGDYWAGGFLLSLAFAIYMRG
jgi:hypothetical protein